MFFILLFILIGRKTHNDHLLPEQASSEQLVVAKKQQQKKNCYSLRENICNKKIKYAYFKYGHASANNDENVKVWNVSLFMVSIC